MNLGWNLAIRGEVSHIKEKVCLIMFKNRVHGKILGPSGVKMIGRCRKMHYFRARKTLAGHMPGMWKRNAYRFLVAKPGEKV